jgi:ElaB/YqjD/DUF883 family membrane-anchored ribosome-binding protein
VTTTIEAAKHAVKDCLDPVSESLRETMRDARRAVRQGRYDVEDFAAATALHVRREPLASIAWAAAAGALAGCLLGFALGRRRRDRSPERYR